MAVTRIFLAFGSKDKTLAATLKAASEGASRDGVQYIAWSAQDVSGAPVQKQVHEWVTECDAAAADISLVNDNVTYEIGLAIGAGKDLRLIRSVGYDDKELREIGLLDGLIWDGYKTRNDLDVLLGGKLAPKNKWAQAKRDTKQPIYVVSPSTPNTTATKLFSAVKKQTRFKFRSFKAWEIGRLSAHEAWEQVALSSGVVVTWEEGEGVEVRRSNQRAALVYGMARGRGIPALLIAHKKALLPADLKEQAARWSDLQHIDGLLRDFRDDVQDELNELEEEQPLPIALLDAIDCGDAAAENEQERLKRYFLETEEFKRTLSGAANLVVGRKGSGKSAIFLQTRDRVRADKKNIVVDLNPEGYQLIKLKELLVELQSQGTRKEFIAAFWQYVLWLEIAYKILEKDERLARRDSFLGERYAKLSDARFGNAWIPAPAISPSACGF